MSNGMDRVDDHISNHNYVILLYRLLEDPVDKFIVMSCLQLGFTQCEVALMLGLSQVAVSKKLKGAREQLKVKQDQVIL